MGSEVATLVKREPVPRSAILAREVNQMFPAVGDAVLYVENSSSGGESVPATVTKLDSSTGMIDLTIDSTSEEKTRVLPDQTVPFKIGTWHFPA